MKAILVDDEPIMLRSFIRNSAGIPDLEIVAQFQSAEEAITYAKNSTFDLAFVDLVLPQINGVTLASMLRTINPKLLVVFISAHIDSVQIPEDQPADFYLSKPYHKVIIEDMMQKLKAKQSD